MLASMHGLFSFARFLNPSLRKILDTFEVKSFSLRMMVVIAFKVLEVLL